MFAKPTPVDVFGNSLVCKLFSMMRFPFSVNILIFNGLDEVAKLCLIEFSSKSCKESGTTKPFLSSSEMLNSKVTASSNLVFKSSQ